MRPAGLAACRGGAGEIRRQGRRWRPQPRLQCTGVGNDDTPVPNRIGAVVPDVDGRLFAMPGYVPSQGALVTKLVSLFPRNAGTALPTHQAVIVVFDAA